MEPFLLYTLTHIYMVLPGTLNNVQNHRTAEPSVFSHNANFIWRGKKRKVHKKNKVYTWYALISCFKMLCQVSLNLCPGIKKGECALSSSVHCKIQHPHQTKGGQQNSSSDSDIGKLIYLKSWQPGESLAVSHFLSFFFSLLILGIVSEAAGGWINNTLSADNRASGWRPGPSASEIYDADIPILYFLHHIVVEFLYLIGCGFFFFFSCSSLYCSVLIILIIKLLAACV